MLNRALRIARCRLSHLNQLNRCFADKPDGPPPVDNQIPSKPQNRPNQEKPQRKFLFGIKKEPTNPKPADSENVFQEKKNTQVIPKETQNQERKFYQPRENTDKLVKTLQKEDTTNKQKTEATRKVTQMDYSSKILTFTNKEVER